MKNLLKFSVTSCALDKKYTLIKLIDAVSKQSRLKPEDETLEAFAENVRQIGFVLCNKIQAPKRGEIVTLEFFGNDLKYMFIKGHKHLIVPTSDNGLYSLKPQEPIREIDSLPELFRHRIKYLAEFSGENFLKWNLQKEIDGCELSAAVFNNFFEGTKLIKEKDFADVGRLIRPEGYQFIDGCPINFALSMCLALQACPTGILLDSGNSLLKNLALWPVMYLPICGDLDGELYQPNKDDLISYIKTQIY